MGQCGGKSYERKEGQGRAPGMVAPLHEGHILAIKRLTDNRICTAGSDASIVISDWTTHSPITTLVGHKKAVSRVAQSPKSPNLLCSCSRDLSIVMWNLESESCIQTILDAHSLNITGLALSPDGTQLCSGSRDYSTKIWDVETGEVIREYSSSRNIVTCITWPQFDHPSSPLDGNIVLQGSEDLCVRGWDFRQSSKQPALHLTGFQYFPLCLGVDDTQPLLAAGCKGFNGVGCDVKLWDIRSLRPGKFLREIAGHQQDVTCCSFLPRSPSPMLLSGSRDSTLKTWALDTHITTGPPAQQSQQPTELVAVSSFSDRSSYNCLDSWFEESTRAGEGTWMCCLGDMDGSVSVLSLDSRAEGRGQGWDLVWKSAPYVAGEEYEES